MTFRIETGYELPATRVLPGFRVETAKPSTGHFDNLGVEILVGDTVTITAWGAPVRLIDTGRRSVVTGVNRAGNLVLASEEIANGRGVRPGYVLVARRDGLPGHEGNRTTATDCTCGARDFASCLCGISPRDFHTSAHRAIRIAEGA